MAPKKKPYFYCVFPSSDDEEEEEQEVNHTSSDEENEPYSRFYNKGPNDGLFTNEEFDEIFEDGSYYPPNFERGWDFYVGEQTSEFWLYTTPIRPAIPTKTTITRDWTNVDNTGYDSNLQLLTQNGFKYIRDIDFEYERIAVTTPTQSKVVYEAVHEFLQTSYRSQHVISINEIKFGENQQMLYDARMIGSKHNHSFQTGIISNLDQIENIKLKTWFEVGYDGPVAPEYLLVKNIFNLDTPEKSSAFYKIAGFFLGDGSMAYDVGTQNGRISFYNHKKRDPVYTTRNLKALGLKKKVDWSAHIMKKVTAYVINVRNPLYAVWYDKIFGHRYKHSRNHQQWASKLTTKAIDKAVYMKNIPPAESRAIADGINYADGLGPYRKKVFTSSLEFVNFLTVIMVHAGYSTFTNRADQVQAYHYEGCIIYGEEYSSLRDDEKILCKPIETNGYIWVVNYSATNKRDYKKSQGYDREMIYPESIRTKMWTIKNSTGFTIVRSVERDKKNRITRLNSPTIVPVLKIE